AMVTSEPSTRILPESGWCTPAIILISVDLPAPFSPSSAWTCPRRTDKVTSLITLTGPKDLETLTSCKTVSSVWSGIKCTSFLVLGRKFNGFTGDEPGLYHGSFRRGFTGERSNEVTQCRAAHLFDVRSEEHTSELQSRFDLVCRLLLEKKKRP